MRFVALIFRFFKNSKSGKKHGSNIELGVDEMEHAEQKELKIIQEDSFSVVCDKSISSLDPFIGDFLWVNKTED